MKDERFSIAGNGLKLMFIGQLVALFSIVPLVGGLAAIVGAIISIVGLVKTIQADPGYKRALIMLVLGIASTVLMTVMAGVAAGGALMGSGGAAAGGLMGVLVLSLAASVFGFLQTYCVCTATSGLLREIDQEDEAARGDLVWKLNALCYLIGIVIAVVTFVSAGAAGFLGVVSKLVSLAAGVLYVIFLYKSHTIMLT